MDTYISNSADFAKPILNHLRKLVHLACPEIIETIKWSFPNFEYKGQILCSMAAHKKHCSFGFWLGSEMPDPDGIINQIGNTAMGSLGKIYKVADLPKDELLIAYIKQAMDLVDKGIKKSAPPKTEKKELLVPEYLTEALKNNAAAKATFEAFSYSNKKEYVEWLHDAKTETTRQKRLAEALIWLSEGKVRNWKYTK